MKKIFVAYADQNMAYSLFRIGQQARALKIFDDVILYTPDDLPDYIKQSSLIKYSYGGGYWCWKPAIIHETLQKYEDGSVVCYVDAGCTLSEGVEWKLFFELMKTYSVLCFHYPEIVPEWKRFGSCSTKIKYWTKKSALLFLDSVVGTQAYREQNKVMGGVLFFKGKSNSFLSEWLKITLNSPQIIIDPIGEEKSDQYDFFAQHKHDQSVITALTYKFKDDVMVLPELFEGPEKDVAICASRIRTCTRKDYVFFKLKQILRSLLGKSLTDKIKISIKKQ